MSPIGFQFATATGSVVRLWDASGELRTQFSLQTPVLDGQFTTAGSRLAVVAFDTVRFFNLRGEPMVQLAGHVGAVRRVMFTPGSSQVLTGGVDGTVRLWDLSRPPLAPTRRPKIPCTGFGLPAGSRRDRCHHRGWDGFILEFKRRAVASVEVV